MFEGHQFTYVVNRIFLSFFHSTGNIQSALIFHSSHFMQPLGLLKKKGEKTKKMIIENQVKDKASWALKSGITVKYI